MRALIVEDGGQRGALGAARALGRAGWAVGVASPVAGMAAHSKYARWHEAASPVDGIEPFVAGVRAAVAAGGYEVVLAAGDAEVLALTAERGRIPAAIAHPDHRVVRRALDKLELSRAAEQVGLAVPSTWAGVPPVGAGGRLVVKERLHGEPAGRGSRPHRPVAVVEDMAGAAAAVADIEATGGHAVVQEFLEGDLLAVAALAVDGSAVVAAVGQRAERTWPTGAGPSVRATVVPLGSGLRAAVAAFLRELEWTGLVELQFLVAADDVPRIIDVNGRIYGSVALSEGAGVPLVAAWAAWASGRPLPPLPEPRAGARYQWLEGDLRRAWAERRGGLARDVAGSLAYARGATEALLARDDLRPVAHVAGVLARRALRKAGRR